MKKFKKFLGLFLVFCMVIPLLEINMQTIYAAEQSDVITKFEVTDEDGKPLEGEVEKWQKIRIYGFFELPDNEVHKDDITVLTLPDQIKFGDGIAPFDLKDDNGEIVAHAMPSINNKTITLTYTDYVETHSGVRGSFYFYIRVDHEKYPDAGEIPIAINVSGKTPPHPTIKFKGVGQPDLYVLRKSSWQVSGAPNPRIGYIQLTLMRPTLLLKTAA